MVCLIGRIALIIILVSLVAVVVIVAAVRSRVSSSSPTPLVASPLVVYPFTLALEFRVELVAFLRGMVVLIAVSAMLNFHHPGIALERGNFPHWGQPDGGFRRLVLASHLVNKPIYSIGQDVFGLAIVVESVMGLSVQISNTARIQARDFHEKSESKHYR